MDQLGYMLGLHVQRRWERVKDGRSARDSAGDMSMHMLDMTSENFDDNLYSKRSALQEGLRSSDIFSFNPLNGDGEVDESDLDSDSDAVAKDNHGQFSRT
jgi:hypothetical protein